ncbi:MAG: hypothetical protein QXT25_02340 [Candidatus Anstonellaceae archaeon]
MKRRPQQDVALLSAIILISLVGLANCEGENPFAQSGNSTANETSLLTQNETMYFGNEEEYDYLLNVTENESESDGYTAAPSAQPQLLPRLPYEHRLPELLPDIINDLGMIEIVNNGSYIFEKLEFSKTRIDELGKFWVVEKKVRKGREMRP